MVKDENEFDEILGPVDPDEPEMGDAGHKAPDRIWMRGLMMLILAVMFGLAETVLGVLALIQFLWMLVTKEKNALLMDFGADLGNWLADVARFQSGATEDKPFPWAKWG